MRHTEDRPQRAVAIWLFARAALLYSVLAVGGTTRLTRSGLWIASATKALPS